MIQVSDESERKERGLNELLVAQTTLKRHENKTKNKKQKKSNGTYSTRHEPLLQKWMDGDTNS